MRPFPDSKCQSPDRSGPLRRSGSAEHIAVLGISAAIIILAGLLQYDFNSIKLPGIRQPLPQICLMPMLTGQPCPGCGLTRGLAALAHGRLSEALRYNQSSLAVFVFVLLQIPYRAYRLRQPKLEARPWLPAVPGFLALAGAIAWWMIRLAG